MNNVDFIKDYGEEQYNTGKIETSRDLLNDNEISLKSAITRLTILNCGLEKISEITGLSITEIEAIQNQ